MSFVLDASVSLGWLFEDEVTPAIDRLFDTVVGSSAIVPAHWHLEVCNGLQVAIRRRRIDRDFRDRALQRLRRLTIEADAETGHQAWTTTLGLSDLYALTLYDAAYLELAQRRRLALATLDADLRQAAERCGVETLDFGR